MLSTMAPICKSSTPLSPNGAAVRIILKTAALCLLALPAFAEQPTTPKRSELFVQQRIGADALVIAKLLDDLAEARAAIAKLEAENAKLSEQAPKP